jgi:hypothetical protein
MYFPFAESMMAVAVTVYQHLNVLYETDCEWNWTFVAWRPFVSSWSYLDSGMEGDTGRRRGCSFATFRKRRRKQLNSTSHSFLSPTHQFVYVRLVCDWQNIPLLHFTNTACKSKPPGQWTRDQVLSIHRSKCVQRTNLARPRLSLCLPRL